MLWFWGNVRFFFIYLLEKFVWNRRRLNFVHTIKSPQTAGRTRCRSPVCRGTPAFLANASSVFQFLLGIETYCTSKRGICAVAQREDLNPQPQLCQHWQGTAPPFPPLRHLNLSWWYSWLGNRVPGVRTCHQLAALEDGGDLPLAVLQQESAVKPLFHLLLPVWEDRRIHRDQIVIKKISACHFSCSPFTWKNSGLLPLQFMLLHQSEYSYTIVMLYSESEKRNFPNSMILSQKLSRYKNKMIQNVCLHIQINPYGTFTRDPYNPTQS